MQWEGSEYSHQDEVGELRYDKPKVGPRPRQGCTKRPASRSPNTSVEREPEEESRHYSISQGEHSMWVQGVL